MRCLGSGLRAGLGAPERLQTADCSHGGECVQVSAQRETGEHAAGEPQSLRGGGVICEHNALIFASLNFLNFL